MTSYHIGLSEEALYERLVAEAGLYDLTFFTTKGNAGTVAVIGRYLEDCHSHRAVGPTRTEG